MHIRISLGTKFHFKQAILNFGTKYAQKGYLHNSGQIQSTFPPKLSLIKYNFYGIFLDCAIPLLF